ncbi:MAG: CDP-alcohol phosphatidyltransferase family protein [Candidatus Aenigmarchaeota archaeon]|nr:CDP-alcohol phosphatidyltransferase family protein [Candidatus Aenigmarchaeota archaeon]
MFFKAKDIITAGTILCGFLVLVFAAMGYFLTASLLILLGALLDISDGVFARLTKTGNAFGKEFDLIADLVIYSMAPGILLFFVYQSYNIYIAAIVGMLPLLFGCIRLARFNVKGIEYPGYWFGFPRPGSAIAIVAFVNSYLFNSIDLILFGTVFIAVMAIMNISLVPYIGHHKRIFTNRQKILFAAAAIVGIAAAALGYGWDVIFIYAIGYLISPIFISRTKRMKINIFIEKWKK